jgi:O-methyltransferase
MIDSDIEAIYGKEFLDLWKIVRDCTMVSVERAYATFNACRYVCRYGIAGDFVECGVYRGGMAMLAALVFSKMGQTSRGVWLFDTFAGMSAPTDVDMDRQGLTAVAALEIDPAMCRAELDQVRSNVARVAYPNTHFIQGDVLQTLRQPLLPDVISVLRLDTDWYESTKIELDVLYPRLVNKGVVLVDDYGHWLGSRKAVDEFIEELNIPVHLTVTDSTGVEFLKII